MDYKKIDNVELDGLNNGYNDFADAFIITADYDGKEMTEGQLDILNEDSDFVYQCIQKQLC